MACNSILIYKYEWIMPSKALLYQMVMNQTLNNDGESINTLCNSQLTYTKNTSLTKGEDFGNHLVALDQSRKDLVNEHIVSMKRILLKLQGDITYGAKGDRVFKIKMKYRTPKCELEQLVLSASRFTIGDNVVQMLYREVE